MKRFSRLHTSRGFSLMELVTVIVILGIIVAASVHPMYQGLNAYIANRNATEATWQARYALERMARDLRVITSQTDITTATASQITFKQTDNSGNSHTINYQLTGSQLVFSDSAGAVPSVDVVLANGISSLAFAYYDRSGTAISTPITNLSLIRFIVISLTVTLNNANFTVSSGVYPRNLP